MSAAIPLPILDKDHLSAMTGADAGLASEILDLFGEQVSVWSRLLDPKEEARRWGDAAHSLKGASLAIGAIRLAAACEKAERTARQDPAPSPAHAAVLLSDIKDCLGDALEAAARTAHELRLSSGRWAS